MEKKEKFIQLIDSNGKFYGLTNRGKIFKIIEDGESVKWIDLGLPDKLK